MAASTFTFSIDTQSDEQERMVLHEVEQFATSLYHRYSDIITNADWNGATTQDRTDIHIPQNIT